MSGRKITLIIFLISSLQMFAQTSVRYQLNSISFTGNNSFSSSALSDIIYSQPTPWWFWKFLHSFSSLGKEAVYFDSTNIPIDLRALEDYYKSNGFFKAKFSYNYFIDSSDKSVNLVYNINENAPSTFGKLELMGLDSVPRFLYDEIYNEVKLDTTQRFSEGLVQTNTNKVISYMLDVGYLFFKWDTTVVMVDTTKNKTKVDIYFNPGIRYSIDTILVQKTGEGADLVTEQLLRDITGIRKGDVYNLDALRMSQVRLYRTGLFNSVMLTSVEKDTVGAKVPIKLEGNIGKMNELSPEVILNNQQRAINVGLGFAFIKKNFFGDARKLTISSSFGVQDIIKADFANLIRRFSFRDTTLLGYVDSRITIDQPYLFEKPIFGTWETYATINKQPDYNNTVYGSKLTIEFEMPVYTFINHLSTSYTVEQSNEVYRVFNDSLSTKLISDIAADAASTTADNILFPTQGYNLSFHIEEANAIPYLISKLIKKEYTGAMFYKFVLNSSYYASLDRKRNSIAAFKLKVGHLQTFFGDFAGVPINRTFYAGGSNSIRGWSSNQLVPEGSQVIRGITGVNNVKGGSFLIEGTLEYRYKFLDNIGVAVFSDFGNSWLGYHQFRWDGVALAAGFGFRYYTQVVPFRIDFGLRMYDPGVKEYIWNNWDKAFFKNFAIHFGIGEAF